MISFALLECVRVFIKWRYFKFQATNNFEALATQNCVVKTRIRYQNWSFRAQLVHLARRQRMSWSSIIQSRPTKPRLCYSSSISCYVASPVLHFQRWSIFTSMTTLPARTLCFTSVSFAELWSDRRNTAASFRPPCRDVGLRASSGLRSGSPLHEALCHPWQ